MKVEVIFSSPLRRWPRSCASRTAEARAKRIALPDAKCRVIYADPPWKYNDKADAGAVQSSGAAHKYPTMTITELTPEGRRAHETLFVA